MLQAVWVQHREVTEDGVRKASQTTTGGASRGRACPGDRALPVEGTQAGMVSVCRGTPWDEGCGADSATGPAKEGGQFLEVSVWSSYTYLSWDKLSL